MRVARTLDYEAERSYTLTVEARDMAGNVAADASASSSSSSSSVAYATVDVSVLDVNDNAPEISVSFPSSLARNMSSLPSSPTPLVTVYVAENTASDFFIAHVSVKDRDASMDNGRVEWRLVVTPLLASG